MKTKSASFKGILLYNIFFLIAAVGFYFLIPIMLNYPPNSINNSFEQSIDMGMKYDWQYIGVILVAILISNVYFINRIKKIEKYKLYIDKTDDKSKEELEKIKKKCFSYPYQIYMVHAFLPSIAIATIMWLTGAGTMLTSRIVMLIFSFTLVLGLLAYIFSKGIFNNVLTELGNRKKYKGSLKIGFKEKIFLLFLPLLFVAILFAAITADTLLARERGDFIFENYKTQIIQQNLQIDTEEEAISVLKNIQKHEDDDILFIITEDNVIYQDKEDSGVDEFFRKYTFNVATDGHTYGYYASGVQGVYFMTIINGQRVAAGIMYRTDSAETAFFLIYTVLTLLLMCVFFLENFAKDISGQVSTVAENMNLIANEEIIDYSQKLPVLSNDELGDLVISFNKILDLEKKHAETMEKNQEILVEQERLSSLGQLIGGIAHNLKTPIMSISGASQAVRELIKEYDASIGNPQVTEEDFHDIAKEMNEWNDKIKVYLEYMTEIINAAKGQAVSMNASTITEFTVEELVARVQILMREQLMHRACNLNLIKKDLRKNTRIAGEISAIVQVVNNLIINAIDAYQKKPGEINLEIDEDDTKIYITVEDFAGGIPENVQAKLFKQMITTKGKDGTGLGLYMCYSTIKGKFNGEMSFQTEEGKGTKFLIELNKKV